MKSGESFLTKWYDYENVWSESIHSIIDLATMKYTDNGEYWEEIEEDHL